MAMTQLVGRHDECDALDTALLEARSGRSQVLVLRGDPGIGKSALLGYLSGRVDGWRVASAVGIESEMELAYSSLHQLCGSMVEQLDQLPAPQRDALATVFGLCAGPPPDRFLVGLATLTLLAEVSERQPLACIVDDVQWLDQATATVLGFVARRLLAERIAIVCASRAISGDDALSGLPELHVDGLADTDARALLHDHVHGVLDAAVADQLVRESHGNPLALIELPRTWTLASVAGGFGLPAAPRVASKITQSYAQRLAQLPPDSRLLGVMMSAEPLGDLALLQRAAETLGIDLRAAQPAVDAGLLEVGARAEFAHPLVRTAAYQSATNVDRIRVHRALADVTDPHAEPDRRAWHRAQATVGMDEDVAAELERSAGRARARGGVAAAAAFMRRSTALTSDAPRRTERALAAAQASLEAGAFKEALALLASVAAAPLGDLQSARVHLLRGRIAAASSFGSAAAELLAAARELESLDADLARETYLDAWGAAVAAGDLAPENLLRDISRAAGALPPPNHEPYPSDRLLDGLARLVTGGLADAAPALQDAVTAFRGHPTLLQWGLPAVIAAASLWEMDAFEAMTVPQLQLARDTGALALLARALQAAGMVASWRGDLSDAGALVGEADAVRHASGVSISPYGEMLLAAYRGGKDDAANLLERVIATAAAKGEGLGVQYAQWATAVLCNGLGRYGQALDAARQASVKTPELFISDWALIEEVEAGVRSGDAGQAANAADRLTSALGATDADWARGVTARAQALVSKGDAAERCYEEAILRLGRTPLRPEIARAHLLYGEWLRREARRVDARKELRTAHDMFNDIGMEAFGARARRELMATGQRVRKRRDDTRDDLTPQEQQIAGLARDGLSNPEIASRLFLSSRTVEWHLRKVFTKLDIASRRELQGTLLDRPR
jgi:DNA-binding CsgD family transcriptional regulator